MDVQQKEKQEFIQINSADHLGLGSIQVIAEKESGRSHRAIFPCSTQGKGGLKWVDWLGTRPACQTLALIGTKKGGKKRQGGGELAGTTVSSTREPRKPNEKSGGFGV